MRPLFIVLIAERPDRHVTLALHKLTRGRRRLRSNSVDVHFEFFAVCFEGQVVDVVAEWVLDFAADGGEPDDDVCGEDAAGDGNPLQRVNELEGKHHDVDPGDLGDGDGVGDGERSLKDAVHAGEGLVELHDTSDGLVLVQTNLQRLVVDDAVHVAGDVVQDFEGEVAERLLGALDPLAWIGLGEGDSKVLTNSLDLSLLFGLGNVELGSFGESVEELNAVAEIGVVDARLESKPVLDRASEGIKKVQGGAVMC